MRIIAEITLVFSAWWWASYFFDNPDKNLYITGWVIENNIHYPQGIFMSAFSMLYFGLFLYHDFQRKRK